MPILVTSDLDILQEIFIKQNTSFSARKVITFNLINRLPRHLFLVIDVCLNLKRLPLMHHDNSKQVNLIFSTKARWKRMRCM